MGFRLPCQASQARATLRHSILNNIILRLTLEKLTQMCLYEPNEWMRCHAAGAEFLKCFSNGYSPRVLLDTNATLRSLDGAVRRKLGDLLDTLYAERFLPVLLQKELSVLLTRFLSSLDLFEYAARDSSEERLRMVYASLLDAAKALRAELDQLPGGVWLP